MSSPILKLTRVFDLRLENLASEFNRYQDLLHTIEDHLENRNYSYLDTVFDQLIDAQSTFHVQFQSSNDLNKLLEKVLTKNKEDPNHLEKAKKFIECMQRAHFTVTPEALSLFNSILVTTHTHHHVVSQQLPTALKV